VEERTGKGFENSSLSHHFTFNTRNCQGSFIFTYPKKDDFTKALIAFYRRILAHDFQHFPPWRLDWDLTGVFVDATARLYQRCVLFAALKEGRKESKAARGEVDLIPDGRSTEWRAIRERKVEVVAWLREHLDEK